MNYTKTYQREDLVIQWGREKLGFGEIVFFYEGDKLMCDNEMMSKEFIKQVLNDFVDEAECLDSIRKK